MLGNGIRQEKNNWTDKRIKERLQWAVLLWKQQRRPTCNDVTLNRHGNLQSPKRPEITESIGVQTNGALIQIPDSNNQHKTVRT